MVFGFFKRKGKEETRRQAAEDRDRTRATRIDEAQESIEADPGDDPVAQLHASEPWKKLVNYVDTHPLFKLVTFDGLYWVDPFLGKKVSAPFDLRETILHYFTENQHWKTAKLKSAVQLRGMLWTGYLEDNLESDARFHKFNRMGQWINPWNLMPSQAITSKLAERPDVFLKRVAMEMAQHAEATPHSMRSLEALEIDLGLREPAKEPEEAARPGTTVLRSDNDPARGSTRLNVQTASNYEAPDQPRPPSTRFVTNDGAPGSGSYPSGQQPAAGSAAYPPQHQAPGSGIYPPQHQAPGSGIYPPQHQAPGSGVYAPAGVTGSDVFPQPPPGVTGSDVFPQPPPGVTGSDVFPQPPPAARVESGVFPHSDSGRMPAAIPQPAAGGIPVQSVDVVPGVHAAMPGSAVYTNINQLRTFAQDRTGTWVQGGVADALPIISLRPPGSVAEREEGDPLIPPPGQLPVVHQSELSEDVVRELVRSLQKISLAAGRMQITPDDLKPRAKSEPDTEELGLEPTESVADGTSAQEPKPESFIGEVGDDIAGGSSSTFKMRKAVDDDEDYEQDMSKAKKVQNHLLGGIPALDGVELALEYTPYSHIGGDFYNIIKIDSNRFFFIVGDVSGHGVQAALIVSSIVNTLKIIFKNRTDYDLLEIVCELNDFMRECLMTGQFFTAFAGIMTTHDKGARLESVCCGHHPTVCLNEISPDEVREVGSMGMGIGLVGSNTMRRQMEVDVADLSPGDTLCIYTDGLLEMMDENGEELGETLVRCSFVAHLGKPPQELVTAVLKDIHAESDGVITDDQTILLIRVEQPRPPLPEMTTTPADAAEIEAEFTPPGEESAQLEADAVTSEPAQAETDRDQATVPVVAGEDEDDLPEELRDLFADTDETKDSDHGPIHLEAEDELTTGNLERALAGETPPAEPPVDDSTEAPDTAEVDPTDDDEQAEEDGEPSVDATPEELRTILAERGLNPRPIPHPAAQGPAGETAADGPSNSDDDAPAGLADLIDDDDDEPPRGVQVER